MRRSLIAVVAVLVIIAALLFWWRAGCGVVVNNSSVAGSGAGPVLSAESAAAAAAGIERGVDFLVRRQQPNGAWLENPAVTSLAVTAIAFSPNAEDVKFQASVAQGLDYVVSKAQADGAIWNTETEQYPNYSTAVSLIALGLVNREQDVEVMRAARRFLLGSQFSDVSPDDPSYGGIGYGRQLRPDLSNMQWALEALRVTDHLDREPLSREPGAAAAADLAWERALEFLKNVQNLPAVNDAVWVASDPENVGGFVYMPEESKAGGIETEDGRIALRSYGSMTYAGLKSLIYAKLDREDVRVQSAVEWLGRNYTWSENPGMAMSGYYYYVHTGSKALSAFGQEFFTDPSGGRHGWREDVIEALLQRQMPEGQWQNSDARWWESTPELVTAYAVIALEIAAGNEQLGIVGGQ